MLRRRTASGPGRLLPAQGGYPAQGGAIPLRTAPSRRQAATRLPAAMPRPSPAAYGPMALEYGPTPAYLQPTPGLDDCWKQAISRTRRSSLVTRVPAADGPAGGRTYRPTVR